MKNKKISLKADALTIDEILPYPAPLDKNFINHTESKTRYTFVNRETTDDD